MPTLHPPHVRKPCQGSPRLIPLHLLVAQKRFHLLSSAPLDLISNFFQHFFKLMVPEYNAYMRKIGKFLKTNLVGFKILISIFFLKFPRKFFFAKRDKHACQDIPGSLTWAILPSSWPAEFKTRAIASWKHLAS